MHAYFFQTEKWIHENLQRKKASWFNPHSLHKWKTLDFHWSCQSQITFRALYPSLFLVVCVNMIRMNVIQSLVLYNNYYPYCSFLNIWPPPTHPPIQTHRHMLGETQWECTTRLQLPDSISCKLPTTRVHPSLHFTYFPNHTPVCELQCALHKRSLQMPDQQKLASISDLTGEVRRGNSMVLVQ